MEKKTLQEVQQFDEQKFTRRVVFQQGEDLVFVLNFMPGQTLPPHSHPGAAVAVLMLEGGGTAVVDGREHVLSRGDMLQVTGDETLSFTNTGDSPASLYIILSKLSGGH